MRNTITRITGGTLSVAFLAGATGACLCSVKDMVLNRSYLDTKSELFTLKLRNLENGQDKTVSSATGWLFSSVVQNGDGVIVTCSGHTCSDGLSVLINVTTDGRRLLFDTEVINNSQIYSVVECDYPALTVSASRNTFAFFPYGSGEVYNTAKLPLPTITTSYPSYGASMQFLSVYNTTMGRGIYYGVHDPAPASKHITVSSSEENGTVTVKASQLLSNVKSGKNSQKLCGTLVWQGIEGNWYEAAQLYREFIESEAFYAPEFTEQGRKDLPDWSKSICHWFNLRVEDETKPFADGIIKRAAEIGVSTGVHLYYWHKIPFDNDYPHYFPMKDNVVAELKKLHDAGIKVMPYINGRLWDTRDKGCEDWQFSSLAKPYATKQFDGTPFIETYSSKETDGSKVELAVMCPSTTLWQDKVEEIVLRLFDVGFDAVYIDQIAAAEAKPCCDPSHNHPAGGGEWWCRSYNTMLERIRRKMPEDRLLTTECTADPFMKYVGGFLTWLWVRNGQVPAFPAVYSDKVITFGTDFRGLGNGGYALRGDLNENGAAIFIAQSFLFGQQMGWIVPEVYDVLPCKNFYVRLVRQRSNLLRFFNSGRLLKPPVVTSDCPAVVCDQSREAIGHLVEEPAVSAQIWECNTTGERIMLVTNIAPTPAHAVIEKCGFTEGAFATFGDQQKVFSVKDGKGGLSLDPYGFIGIYLN